MVGALTSNNEPISATWTIYVDWNNDGDYNDSNENITDYVMDATWKIGMSRPYQEFADETRLTLVLMNNDRRFSPEYSSGVLYGKLKPQRRVKVTAKYSLTTFTMYTGWIESIQPEPMANGSLTCTITCVGAKQFLEKTTFESPLLENVRADEAISSILQSVQIPPSIDRAWILGRVGNGELESTTYLADLTQIASLEIASDVLPYVGDGWEDGIKAVDAIQSLVMAERGKFFYDRSGVAVFWNRSHLQLLNSTDLTLTDHAQSLRYTYGEGITNVVKTTVYPRTLGATNTEILWELNEPAKVREGDTKTIRARYNSDENQTVSARDVQLPSGGDFVVSSGSCTISMEADARSATLTLTNTGLGEAVVSTIVVRGQKVTAYDREEIMYEDTSSITDYGRREMSINTKLMASRDLAEAVGQWEAGRRSQPRGMISQVMLINRNYSYLAAMIELTIGNTIRVSETQTAHADNYVIMGEEHHIWDGLKRHETRWYLEPRTPVKSWILGVTGRSELDQVYPGL